MVQTKLEIKKTFLHSSSFCEGNHLQNNFQVQNNFFLSLSKDIQISKSLKLQFQIRTLAFDQCYGTAPWCAPRERERESSSPHFSLSASCCRPRRRAPLPACFSFGAVHSVVGVYGRLAAHSPRFPFIRVHPAEVGRPMRRWDGEKERR